MESLNLVSKDQNFNWQFRRGNRDYFLGLLGLGVNSLLVRSGGRSVDEPGFKRREVQLVTQERKKRFLLGIIGEGRQFPP